LQSSLGKSLREEGRVGGEAKMVVMYGGYSQAVRRESERERGRGRGRDEREKDLPLEERTA
jgi:hypothetical protein